MEKNNLIIIIIVIIVLILSFFVVSDRNSVVNRLNNSEDYLIIIHRGDDGSERCYLVQKNHVKDINMNNMNNMKYTFWSNVVKINSLTNEKIKNMDKNDPEFTLVNSMRHKLDDKRLQLLTEKKISDDNTFIVTLYGIDQNDYKYYTDTSDIKISSNH